MNLDEQLSAISLLIKLRQQRSVQMIKFLLPPKNVLGIAVSNGQYENEYWSVWVMDAIRALAPAILTKAREMADKDYAWQLQEARHCRPVCFRRGV